MCTVDPNVCSKAFQTKYNLLRHVKVCRDVAIDDRRYENSKLERFGNNLIQKQPSLHLTIPFKPINTTKRSNNNAVMDDDSVESDSDDSVSDDIVERQEISDSCNNEDNPVLTTKPVSYTHLRAHET